jgi:uncharacterized protein with von Willebrand factor type A (vWA) domain
MFVTFFQELKSAGVPVTLREYLTLMQAMQADLASRRVEDFYYLSRATLVKDERNLDKFDRVFGHVFKGLENLSDAAEANIPAEWLKKLAEKYLTEEEKKQIEAMGGLDKLLETLRKRLAEQKGRHQGGSKWIGTGGTSPFGNAGYNPEGIRIGGESTHRRAVKVWDKREFKDLDDAVELGTRNIKIALRRLRKFARTGAPEELDLDGTIKGTAHKGYLDILMRPERHNAVKVLLFFDIGGSMDCSRPRAPSSSTWSISTSTIACTRKCGRKTAGDSRRPRQPGTCCTPIRTTIRWCSSAMLRCRLTRSPRRAARSNISTTSRAPPGSSA